MRRILAKTLLMTRGLELRMPHGIATGRAAGLLRWHNKGVACGPGWRTDGRTIAAAGSAARNTFTAACVGGRRLHAVMPRVVGTSGDWPTWLVGRSLRIRR